MTRIVIMGAYGTGNIGDEAVLSGILAGFDEVLGGAFEPVVLSQSPAETEQIHEVQSILLSRRTEVKLKHDVIRQADLVVVGGGGLFQNNRPGLVSSTFGMSVSYLLWSRLAGVKSMVLGAGVGPIDGSIARQYARLGLSSARMITVRDLYSRDVAVTIGVPENRIAVTGDPAYMLRSWFATSQAQKPDARIGLSLRPIWYKLADGGRFWQCDLEEDAIRAVVHAFDTFSEDVNAEIVFLPFGGNQDVNILRKLKRHSRNPERYRLARIHHPKQLVDVYSGLSLMVGMRLHSVIAAAMAGVTCVPVLYDEKVRSASKALGLSDLALEVRDLSTSDMVLSSLQRVWQQRTSLGEQMKAVANIQRERAFISFKIAQQLLNTRQLG